MRSGLRRKQAGRQDAARAGGGSEARFDLRQFDVRQSRGLYAFIGQEGDQSDDRRRFAGTAGQIDAAAATVPGVDARLVLQLFGPLWVQCEAQGAELVVTAWAPA